MQKENSVIKNYILSSETRILNEKLSSVSRGNAKVELILAFIRFKQVKNKQ